MVGARARSGYRMEKQARVRERAREEGCQRVGGRWWKARRRTRQRRATGRGYDAWGWVRDGKWDRCVAPRADACSHFQTDTVLARAPARMPRVCARPRPCVRRSAFTALHRHAPRAHMHARVRYLLLSTVPRLPRGRPPDTRHVYRDHGSPVRRVCFTRPSVCFFGRGSCW